MTAEFDAKPEKPARRGRPPGIKTKFPGDAPHWWTEDFLSRLGEISAAKKINAAKKIVKTGKVVNLSVSPGLIEARVQGSRRLPYNVRIFSSPPEGFRAEDMISRIREKAAYRAAILAGDPPRDLGAIFKAAGMYISLESFSRCQTMCGCSEPEAVCEHILAVAYFAAVEFDRDPFMLFRLRGLDNDDLIRSLCAPDSDAAPSGPAPEVFPEPPGADEPPIRFVPRAGADFYGEPGGACDNARGLPASRPPEGAVSGPMFDFPFWRGEASFTESLLPYYKSAEKFFSK